MFFETFLHLDLTSLLIILVFFLILEYRPPWWSRPTDCKTPPKKIPGPASLPLIGTTWTFIIGKFTINQLHLHFHDLYKKYGGIVREEFWGNIPVISIFEKEDIIKVVKSGGKYPLRPPIEAIAQYRRSRGDRYATVGLVNEQGETWHRLRTALTPSFSSPKTISEFLPQVDEIASDWSNLLKQNRDPNHKIRNLTELTDRLGLEITCALVLGRRMGFLVPENQTEIGKKLADAIRQHFLSTRDTYFGIPFWKFFPTRTYRKLVESEEKIYDLALELIQSANESTMESEIFREILKSQLDEREKTAAIVDFISAGIHTLKNSLLFLLNFIGGDPQIQKKILEDPTKNYAKACLTESFRLLPTANPLARILTEDLTLSGFLVKAGTPVLCHYGLACRREENFKDAEVFRPERWLGEEKGSLLMIPFGCGRRICPGKRFIEQILPVILVNIIKSFEIEVVGEMEVQYEFLMAPKGEVAMIFRDRG